MEEIQLLDKLHDSAPGLDTAIPLLSDIVLILVEAVTEPGLSPTLLPGSLPERISSKA